MWREKTSFEDRKVVFHEVIRGGTYRRIKLLEDGRSLIASLSDLRDKYRIFPNIITERDYKGAASELLEFGMRRGKQHRISTQFMEDVFRCIYDPATIDMINSRIVLLSAQTDPAYNTYTPAKQCLPLYERALEIINERGFESAAAGKLLDSVAVIENTVNWNKPLKKCPRCNGMGEVFIPSRRTWGKCFRCEGNGEEPKYPPRNLPPLPQCFT